MVISVDVTPYSSDDRAAVIGLAPRLRSGVAPWRPSDGVLLAVHQWVEQRHWSGQRDAYVGELVTGELAEGRGVGRALLALAEQWARDHGLDRVTLETGAANARARAFYERQGYRDDEVRLTRILSAQPTAQVTG
jgi:GNAT superfamily N-acetyltransferase